MDTDVLIVGAGPTGLMLACWLERLGIHPLVIDKKQGLTEAQSRALIVQARTLETYDMLGIVEHALSLGMPETIVRLLINQHRVAGIRTAEAGRGLSPYPYLFIMGQDRTEQLLLQHLTAQGGQVKWETSLEGLSSDDEGVCAELRHADGHSEQVRARYVCGCDGASSQVRHALGIGFPGGTYTQRFFLADVQGPARKSEGEINICIDEKFFHAVIPMPGANRYRIIGYVAPSLLDKLDLTYEDVRPYVESSGGIHVTETFWFSTYGSHHRIAEAFRRDRIFLLGDAAHIHSPVGGQGMNTGLMDATNLGWKLAAVIRGEADARLLDSYEPERMAFARLLIKTTDRLFSLVTNPSASSRMFRTVLMSLLSSLISQFPQMRRLFFSLISQTRINYRESPISRGKAGHVHAGDRLPWVQWSEGGSNYDALRSLVPHLQVYGSVSPEIEAFARQHPEFPLTRLPWTSNARRAGFQHGALYFLRPDGYVAYASAHFSSEEFLAFLRDTWGWRGAGTHAEKETIS